MLAAGLSNFFPDGVGNKPWSNHDVDAAFKFLQAEDQWYPTWEGGAWRRQGAALLHPVVA